MKHRYIIVKYDSAKKQITPCTGGLPDYDAAVEALREIAANFNGYETAFGWAEDTSDGDYQYHSIPEFGDYRGYSGKEFILWKIIDVPFR